MKPSLFRCLIIPLLISVPLASAAGWWAFQKYFASDSTRIVGEALAAHPGVNHTVDHHTVQLSGTVATPDARAAAAAAVEGITADWGLRVGQNDIAVPAALTSVVGTERGIKLTGWVREADEKDALVGLVAKEAGVPPPAVDASAVQVLPFVTAAGAAAIGAATIGDTDVGKPLNWLGGLWTALPKPAEAVASLADGVVKLVGRVPDLPAKEGVVTWVQGLRPDLKVDASGIEVVPGTRPVALPAANAAGEGWLSGLWGSLQTKPKLAFRAGSAGAAATLAGVLPKETAAVLSATAKADVSQLVATPAAFATEVPAPALAQLITVVSGLKGGAIDYSDSGLVVRGEATAEQDAAMRGIPLGTYDTSKVHFDLTKPVMAPPAMPSIDSSIAATISPGAIMLTGVVPSEIVRTDAVAVVKALRPDVGTVDGSGLLINAAAKPLELPALAAIGSLSDDAVKARHGWLTGLWTTLKTGPSIDFRAAGPGGKPTLGGAAPEDWFAGVLNGSGLSAGEGIKALNSPVYSAGESDPGAVNLGKLVAAVSPLKGGAVRYDRASGLVVEGEVGAGQAAKIRELSVAPLSADKVRYRLTEAPVAMAAAPTTPAMPVVPALVDGSSVSGNLVDGSFELQGVVPDEAARQSLLSAIKAAAPDAKIVDKMTLLPGIKFPSAAAVGALAGQLAAEPGNRSFSLTDKSLTVGGEVTDALLSKWAPALKDLSAGGFPVTEPKWKVFPSLFHFPSRKVATDLDPAITAQITQTLRDCNIFFDSGSSDIRADQQGKITQLIAAVKSSLGKLKFIIGGHADSSGDPAANQRLSARRVDSVVAALKAGGVTDPFQRESFGASKAEGNDPATKAASRRVEILVR
jgi:OmpA family/BON domain